MAASIGWRPAVAVFYCKNVPGSAEDKRRAIEKAHKGAARLFPIPCGGRLDSLHLLKALEEFADGALLVTCPAGACRYFEGNRWADKRLQAAKRLIESIGLEGARLGVVAESAEEPKELSILAGEFIEKIRALGPSPVLEADRLSQALDR